jgi:hypothetical protein
MNGFTYNFLPWKCIGKEKLPVWMENSLNWEYRFLYTIPGIYTTDKPMSLTSYIGENPKDTIDRVIHRKE